MWKTVLIVVAAALPVSGQAETAPSPQTPGERAGQIDSLNRQACRAFLNRDFQAAQASAQQAWDLCQKGADGPAPGLAAAGLAAVLTMHGRFEKALQWQGRAEEVFVSGGDTTLQGRLEAARAVTNFLRARQYSAGETEEALIGIRKARELLGANDARTANIEAEILCHSNDANRAQSGYMKYMRLLRQCRAKGDSTGLALCATRMGRTEGITGGHGATLKYYTEALGIFRAQKDTGGIGLALRNIGLAQRKQRQYSESEAASQEALDLARHGGNQRLALEVLNDMNLLYAETGEAARAQECDLQAQAAMRSIVEGLKQGQFTDTVLFDFYQLLNMRYVNRPPYDADPFVGFYDQLVLEAPR